MRVVVVAAGGESRRMRRISRNKAFVPFNNKPMIEWVLEVAARVADELIISCALRNFLDYGWVCGRYGARRVLDVGFIGAGGPLRALCSSLVYLRRRGISGAAVCLLACDQPLVSAMALRLLFLHYTRAEAKMVAFRCGGLILPMPALYPQALQNIVFEVAAAGRGLKHAIALAAKRGLLKTLTPLPAQDCFLLQFNANYPWQLPATTKIRRSSRLRWVI